MFIKYKKVSFDCKFFYYVNIQDKYILVYRFRFLAITGISKMQLKFLKISPSGNVTVLVTFPYIASINTRQEVSKIIMERYNDVEQVGFISYLKNNIPRLDMMGGEFCGNATRCLGALLVLDNPSVLKQIAPDCWHVEVSVSGVPSLLDVYLALNGNDINSSVRIAMKDVKYSEKMFNGFSLSVVSMEGILMFLLIKSCVIFQN